MGQAYSILTTGTTINTPIEPMYGYIYDWNAENTSDGIRISHKYGRVTLLQSNPNYEKIKNSLQKNKLILVEVYYGYYSGYILDKILETPVYTATIIYGGGKKDNDWYKINPPAHLDIHKLPEYEILEKSCFFVKNIDNMIAGQQYDIKYVRDWRQSKEYVKDLSLTLNDHNKFYRVITAELVKHKKN